MAQALLVCDVFGGLCAIAVLAFSVYVKHEIVRSKEIIEEKLGASVYAFAYPAGFYTNAAIAVVKSAGYSFARGISAGSQYTAQNFYKLPTLRVFPLSGKRQFRAWLAE